MKEVRHWKWKAATIDGRVQSGLWEYTDLAEVRRGLRDRGLYPLDIRPKMDLSLAGKTRCDIKWYNLSKQISLLLDAGLPLLQALEILANRSPSLNCFSSHQIELVKQKIQAGTELHEAISVLRPLPDNFIRYRLRVGEQSGTLAEAFEEIAASLEQDMQFARKLKSVMAYPAILLSMIMVILLVLCTWILPMYQCIFANLDRELPRLTRVIFKVGDLIPSTVIIGGSFIVAGAVLSFVFPKVKLIFQLAWRKLPVWGGLIQCAEQELFCRVLARYLSSGVPILDALILMRDMEDNAHIQKRADVLADAVNEGRKLATVLKMNADFSPDMCELIRIGEESGKLEESLFLVSKWTRMELEERMRRCSTLLEPALILTMGGIVGLLAIGVLLPIMQTASYLSY